MALDCLPRIEQLFVAPGSSDNFDVDLFMARRYAEQALRGDEDFYVASLSSEVVSYKGLVMPEDLPAFYKDLNDPRTGNRHLCFPPALLDQHGAALAAGAAVPPAGT